MVKNNAYENGIINVVIGLSVSKDYDHAKTEWVFSGEANDHGAIKDQMPVTKCQMCGHPIRYGYIIKNTKNGKKLEVGSECVDNFMNITPSILGKMETAKKNTVNRIKKLNKEALDLAYFQANREAIKVQLMVESYKVQKDRDIVSAIGNNRGVLYNRIESGVLFELAKKYKVDINMDKIKAFMRTYKK